MLGPLQNETLLAYEQDGTKESARMCRLSSFSMVLNVLKTTVLLTILLWVLNRFCPCLRKIERDCWSLSQLFPRFHSVDSYSGRIRREIV